MKRTLEEYLKFPYKMELIEDTEEGGYMVSFPELSGCLTCGDTVESAVRNAADAKLAWLQAAIEDNIDIPVPESVESYSGQLRLRMPKSLHKKLADHSKREGVSMNQYCIYLLSQNDTCWFKS